MDIHEYFDHFSFRNEVLYCFEGMNVYHKLDWIVQEVFVIIKNLWINLLKVEICGQKE
jgi:hypothetical protein